MSVFSRDLIATFEEFWPLSGAEEWDSPGLISGSMDRKISRVLLSVDITSEILDEAINGGFDLILAHHPFLLRGVKTIAEETHKGALLTRSIRTGVDLYSAHTNADVVSDGVSAALASALGLKKSQALVPTGAGVGHGRIGDLPEPVSLGDFARLVGAVLPSTAQGVKVAGDYNMPVQRIALCGGAGDSFIGAAVAAKADVYLTSDLRHHPAQDARESASLNQQKPALIDVAHWAGEWIWLDSAASKLSERFSDVQFVVSHIRTDPWDFVVTQ